MIKNDPNFRDFGKITKFFTCLDSLVENRGVGVTTTLGPGDFICAKGCYLHLYHHRGREFPCGMAFSVSHVFRAILHRDLAIPYHSGYRL